MSSLAVNVQSPSILTGPDRVVEQGLVGQSEKVKHVLRYDGLGM